MSSLAENPYATPDEIDNQPHDFVVDGNRLIIFGSRVQLPDRCVFTNRPTKWYHRTSSVLVWSGKRGQFLIRTRSCRVKHGVCGSIRFRIMLTTLSGALLIGSTLIGLICLARSSYFGLIVSFVAMIIGLVLAWKADAPSLRIVEWDGENFVVSGCCQGFLEELVASGHDIGGTLPHD